MVEVPWYTEPLHFTISPWCSMKIDFPRFDGSNPLQWIFRAEQFFDFYEILDPFCLKITAYGGSGYSMVSNVAEIWFPYILEIICSSYGGGLWPFGFRLSSLWSF